MGMLRLACLAAAAAIVVGACSGAAATAAPTAPPTAAPTTAPAASAGSGAVVPVAIRDFAFDPAAATVGAGGKVTWTNADSVDHTVTFDDATVQSSGMLKTGVPFSVTFAAAGSFAYHCAIHPSMTGTVTVS